MCVDYNPRFLTSSVAFAADSPKLLTFEQCQELIGATETIKVTSKTSKVVENFRKLSGWGANFKVCRHAYNIGVDGTEGSMTLKQAVAFAFMFMLCGGFLTMHALGE